MRAFVGAYPNGNLKSKLIDAQQEFVQFFSFLNPSDPEQVHLTVKYLGIELEGEELQELFQTLRPLLAKRKLIKCQLAELEFGFPGQKSPRILHVRLQRSHKLFMLHREITTLLKALFPEKKITAKHFLPHITLARAKRKLTSAELKSVRNMLKNYTFGDVLNIDQLKIMSSRVEKQEVRYYKLYSMTVGST